MKLLRRGNAANSNEPETTAVQATDAPKQVGTEGKGRPTPKRRDAEGRKRGPVAPAPMTAKEARARRKQSQGTKAERKAARELRRASASDARARMMAGEEGYLLARDKGPVRGYVRDIIDARRNLVGLFMPLALLLILAMFVSPALQAIVTLAMLVMMLFMIIEGIYLSRMISKRVNERFPNNTESTVKLGWYAFVRASQLRRMRAPKPRVSPGDTI
ncbi:DUF3043 domain-containing protein [Skermania sp. ID1734]|uniref:DUF3043 domain-containing protein n=1 Tax=Skermania sp. ID1734 TaxID=2597516 RepID=UPI00118113FA|nr:DUF3043 domain-containing protein [Skermania sp. ID1734]TSE01174.1 DUF3043 domain-containing protein [Skermania sp. ID1734]